MTSSPILKRLIKAATVVTVLLAVVLFGPDLNRATSLVDVQINQAHAQTGGNVPGNVQGRLSEAEIWRRIRQGNPGMVTIPDKQAGIMIQSKGEAWRLFRTETLGAFGVLMLFGAITFCLMFYLGRGRVRIEQGWSGRIIERFNDLERFAHWLVAVSFIILGLTGLNILYGRDVIMPLLGPEAFSTLTELGKLAHNYVGFAFMVGLALIFVLWVKNNFPNQHDLVWLAKFGGLFSKHSHPPAKKFNAGQKILFWLIILGGTSVSVPGVALIFPFQFEMFGPTFAVMNTLGLDLPTTLTAMEEMQLSQLWHSIMALVMIAVVIGHIYIGSLGMEGAFDAMGSGEVDENWAREHHSLWVEEQEKAGSSAQGDD